MNADRMSRIGAVAVVIAALCANHPAWAEEEKSSSMLDFDTSPNRVAAASVGAVIGGVATTMLLPIEPAVVIMGTVMGAGVGYLVTEPPPPSPDGEASSGIKTSSVLRAGAITAGAVLGGVGATALYFGDPMLTLTAVGLGGAGAYMLTAPTKPPTLVMPAGSVVHSMPPLPQPDIYRTPVSAQGYNPYGSY